VVPILVFWFGVGWLPPVLTAFLISFFPIVVNVATGISTIEPEVEDVLRALGASKRDIILKVGVPRAMPYFFGSLKVAITLAYVGSGDRRAERVECRHRQPADTRLGGLPVELVWAALVVLAVLGVVMYAMTVMAERRMTGWAQRSNFSAA
jgi:NitT/TauT family transport system permease protein